MKKKLTTTSLTRQFFTNACTQTRLPFVLFRDKTQMQLKPLATQKKIYQERWRMAAKQTLMLDAGIVKNRPTVSVNMTAEQRDYAARLEKYPNEIAKEDIEKCLTEAAANNKFSIY